MQRMSSEIQELSQRLQDVTTQLYVAKRTDTGDEMRALAPELSFHQQQIAAYLEDSMQAVYEAHGKSMHRRGADAAATTANATLGAHVTHSVRGVRSTVRRLDRVFYEVATGDKQRQLAATKISMMCRGFIVRRRYHKLTFALGRWRARKCLEAITCMEQFSAREEFINGQIVLMHQARLESFLRSVLAEMRDVVLMNLPLRLSRLEETERRFLAKKRALAKMVFDPWRVMALGPRSRKKVAADAKLRHLEARKRLEATERFELITGEMVHDEFLKENIRRIRSAHHLHVLRMYFRLVVTVEYEPMKQKTALAVAHDRRKRLKSVLTVMINAFRTVQVDKAIAKVAERRTLDRFEKHFNMRKIDAHYRRTHQLKHLRAWAQYGQRIRRVRKLFEVNTKDTLVRLIRRWRVRTTYQTALRANAIEEWKAYCRRIFQTPFRAWYVYAAEHKAQRVAKETICIAYQRRQRRHVKYTFFRLWKHQVLFGNIEGIHSKLHLIRSLEDQKRMCIGLEVNARLYRENIAGMQNSIHVLEQKLEEKQQELVQVHEATQVTRFGLHHAEQTIARVQGMLEAVRMVHPGTLERVEKMYSENPLLTKDFKDVIMMRYNKRQELMQEIELDDLELEIQRSGGGNSGLSREDQLLMHRVKWVLSRMELNKQEQQPEKLLTLHQTSGMQQLCALFEFMRDGNTIPLVPENNPSFSDRARDLSSNNNSNVVRHQDLVHASDTWHSFLQALTTKFTPDRMLSVKERLVRREAAMTDEIAMIKANPHIYNIYR